MLWLLVAALFQPVFGQSFKENGVVETPMGFLKGTEVQNVMNGTFYAFFGVPFAKPPVGELRFMPPLPAEPWEGVRDASVESPHCIQLDLITRLAVGQEDCLTIDVFSPKNPRNLKNNPIPVIVIFHGGLFHFGSYSMDESRPDFLMTRDVIVVLVRYRLGIFGFLSFQNEVLSGNAGMKDQVLALKWVRNNIGSFGGDRECVTIAGFSAGAASAHFHMISPLSRGLFHRVIAASGSAIAPWALARYPAKNAEIMSDVYNCSRTSPQALLQCLQAVEPEDLTGAQYNAILVERLLTDFNVFLFHPCIEPKHEHAFLTDDPYELLAKGHMADVPFLTGTTKNEFSLLETLLCLELIPENLRRKVVVEIFSRPGSLIYKEKPYVGSSAMGKAAVKFYFNNQRPSLKNLEATVEFFSDYYFLLPAWDSLTLHLRHKKSSAFQYVFSHESDQLPSKTTLFTSKGVSHGDFYNGLIMYNPANPVDPMHEAFPTIQRAIQIWTNFATYGDPTPDDSLGLQWLPSKLDSRFYLDFGMKLHLRTDPEWSRLNFWTEARKNENFTV